MPELVYPWKRFWCPRGSQISLSDDGFLVDPDGEYAKYYPTDVVDFDSISKTPCLVLLGEPGMGKTTALRDEFDRTKKAVAGTDDVALCFDLRDYSSDERLERKVFGHEALQRWQLGEHALHLFFDSLDEGLLRIDNISRVLLMELERLPRKRLKLRIASRPADWPSTLEKGLMRLWSEENTRVFELAPLRKVDAIEAATISEISDPKSFVGQVIRKDVVPLAFKPVTLEFLLAAFKKDGVLPDSRVDLYLEGCRRLCEESSLERRDSPKGKGELTAGQRLGIASRFAAVTQFSNRSTIWTGLAQGLEPEDLFLESLIGGSEGRLADYAAVDLSALREVLDTGLFSPRGLSRHAWRHQTFAEYLAAYYLKTRKVPLERVRSLIQHPDGSGKIVPQLRETALWLAGMSSEVFHLIVQCDPEVLLGSDIANATSADRANLARRLLESLESGTILWSWEWRRNLAGLNNPELSSIVQPYLRDKSRCQEARLTAIDFVRSCGLTAVVDELVALALDTSETIRIRVPCAASVVDIGTAEHKASFRPLVLGMGADDLQDDLKGYGLLATWPAHITAIELLSALTQPKDENYYGGYQKFLDSEIVGQFKAEDIPAAVIWSRQNPGGHHRTDKISELSAKTLERAIDFVDTPGVADQLAAALFERMSTFTDRARITGRLSKSGNQQRRAVARAMFSMAVADRYGASTLIQACEIRAYDIGWLLDELSLEASVDLRRFISEVIAHVVRPEDINEFDAIWTAAFTDTDLRSAIEPMVRAVVLGSPEAVRMKENHERLLSYESPQTIPEDPPLSQSLSELFAKDTPDVFFHVVRLLRTRKGDAGIGEPLPGWAELDDGFRQQILDSAREYLKSRHSGPAGAWGKNGKSSYAMLAGYSALRLLVLESADSLDRLTDGDWQFWTPIVVTSHVTGADIQARSDLLARAYQRAGDVFRSTLDVMIVSEDQKDGYVFVVNNIDTLWDDQIAAILREKLTMGGLKPGSFKVVLGALLKNNDVEAKLFARHLATSAIPAEGDDRSRTVRATVELISHDPNEWKTVWPVVQADQAFGTEVLQLVASEHEYTSFANVIDEGEVADICLWMAMRGFEKEPEDPNNPGLVTPRIALSHWWNILVKSLTDRGTVAACHALQRVIEALPQYPGLNRNLKDAEEKLRRSTWIPTTLEDIIALGPVLTTVFTLHGIRTQGAWQKQVHEELQNSEFRHYLLDYDHFGLMQFLTPSQRRRKIKWFRAEYERIVGDSGMRPCVIAHSFGTYIVAQAIKRYTELKFDRIIFCGSIVHEDYDWASVIKTGRVNAVLNQYGHQDFPVKIAARCRWFTDAGSAGVKGFSSTHAAVRQQSREEFGHSDYFYPSNYRENWVPFLAGSNLGGNSAK